MRGSIAVKRELLWNASLLDRLRKEALGRSHIAVFTQEKINGLSLPIHRAVQVTPLPFDPNVRFITPPRGTYGSGVALPALHKFRDIPLHPAQNGRMGNGDSPFSRHCGASRANPARP